MLSHENIGTQATHREMLVDIIAHRRARHVDVKQNQLSGRISATSQGDGGMQTSRPYLFAPN